MWMWSLRTGEDIFRHLNTLNVVPVLCACKFRIFCSYGPPHCSRGIIHLNAAVWAGDSPWLPPLGTVAEIISCAGWVIWAVIAEDLLFMSQPFILCHQHWYSVRRRRSDNARSSWVVDSAGVMRCFFKNNKEFVSYAGMEKLLLCGDESDYSSPTVWLVCSAYCAITCRTCGR